MVQSMLSAGSELVNRTSCAAERRGALRRAGERCARRGAANVPAFHCLASSDTARFSPHAAHLDRTASAAPAQGSDQTRPEPHREEDGGAA
ncbi:unnamed protein product [Merluccius merluccius]